MLTSYFLIDMHGQVHLHIHTPPPPNTHTHYTYHTHHTHTPQTPRTPLKCILMLPLVHSYPSSTRRVMITFSITRCTSHSHFFPCSSTPVEDLVPGLRGSLLGWCSYMPQIGLGTKNDVHGPLQSFGEMSLSHVIYSCPIKGLGYLTSSFLTFRPL